MKSVFIFACFFYLCQREEVFQKLDSIRDEALCTAAGGSCTFAADCPKEWLEKHQGLCPDQQRFGVECCYGLSVKERRCQKHGGECIAEKILCNEPALYKEASDCENGTKCCILL